MTTSSISALVTHSGSFHGDDLFAHALLAHLHPGARLIRTRDAALIETITDAIVFDVGNLYDPCQHRFDHHQTGSPEREDGLPYSAFGLVWQYFGRDYIASLTGLFGKDVDVIHEKIDHGLVRDIDAVDNGQKMPDQDGIMHPMTITWMLMDFRPDFDDDDPEAMNQAFLRASTVAGQFLQEKIRTQAARLRARNVVKTAIANRIDPRWIELPRGMPWHGPLLESGADDVLFVINPSGDEWHLNVVNIGENIFEARKDLPSAWAGCRGAEMEKVTGVSGAEFCHTGRFIAAAHSRRAIMQLLDKALNT